MQILLILEVQMYGEFTTFWPNMVKQFFAKLDCKFHAYSANIPIVITMVNSTCSQYKNIQWFTLYICTTYMIVYTIHTHCQKYPEY